jgi:hypothetical protein
MSYAAVWSLQPTPITGSEAFTLLACHDDSHIQRNWTHGNPNDGTFGGSTTPNHSHSYYYLDAQAAAGCARGADGLYHFVGRVTAAGPLANGSPGGVGNPKRTNLRNEHPSWGFEYKTPSGTILHPCIGGDGSGGNNCPENPNPFVVTGGAVAEWRYDGGVSGVRFRVDNQYDETLWEYATLDVVACARCEPGGVTAGATPTPRSTPTATPTPTGSAGHPTPTPTPTAAPTPTGGPSERSAGCSTPITDLFQRTVEASRSTSVFVDTSNVGALSSTVTWSPTNTADLIVYNADTLTVLSKVTGSSGRLTSSIDNLPATAYKVKVHNDGATTITFTLSVTHC